MAGQIEKELQTRLNVLAWHLGFANTHLHYFSKLEESRKTHGFDFLESYDFWEDTKRAHAETDLRDTPFQFWWKTSWTCSRARRGCSPGIRE